jgi:hypothetical protein
VPQHVPQPTRGYVVASGGAVRPPTELGLHHEFTLSHGFVCQDTHRLLTVGRYRPNKRQWSEEGEHRFHALPMPWVVRVDFREGRRLDTHAATASVDVHDNCPTRSAATQLTIQSGTRIDSLPCVPAATPSD